MVSMHTTALPATWGQDLEDEVGSGSFILLHWGREAVPLPGDAGGIVGVSSGSKRNITAWKHLGFVPLSFRHLPDKSRAVLFCCLWSCAPPGDDLAPEQPEEGSEAHPGPLIPHGIQLTLGGGRTSARVLVGKFS